MRFTFLSVTPLFVSWLHYPPMDAGPLLSRGGPPPDNGDGLSCNSYLVLVGDTMAQVLEKCGSPSYIDRRCSRRGCYTEVWTYRLDAGAFPRYVTFVGGTVRSIRAGSRFD
jgi:hypothetical protein